MKYALPSFATLLLCAHANAATIYFTPVLQEQIANDGICTLREAIISANFNFPFGGCIAGQASPIIDHIQPNNPNAFFIFYRPGDDDFGAFGDFDILDDLKISYAPTYHQLMQLTHIATDTYRSPDRIFHVAENVSLELENVYLDGGVAPNADKLGGNILVEDGGELILKNVTFRPGTRAYGSSTGANIAFRGDGSIQYKDVELKDDIERVPCNNGESQCQAPDYDFSTLYFGGNVAVTELP